MKYETNIVKGPFVENAGAGIAGISLQANNNEYGNGLSVRYSCINSTGYKRPEAEKNDYHMILSFIGGNPENIEDFGAEICICLGEDKEEHVITSPVVITIPAGLVHFPLTVNRCEKPIVMLEVLNTTGK